MKLSASIYSYKGKNLNELVRELDRHKIDMFHIDCNDDPGVFDDIKKIRQISKTPIDLHIISPYPEKYFDKIIENSIEYVEFQYEPVKKKIQFPKTENIHVGLGIVSDTPVDVFEPFRDEFDFVLFMTTVPGVSGGSFRKENFQKIRKFRKLFPRKEIHVDGGVNAEVSFILRNIGVSCVVSGSFLVNNSSISKAILDMKMETAKSHYLIKDFMTDLSELPVLKLHEANFLDILKKIEEYGLGFVFFEDENGTFAGLSSNADIRRGLLNNQNNLNGIKLEDVRNKNPLVIDESATIDEMLRLVKTKRFPINFLPVVDNSYNLTGAVTFYNLIRGES